MKRNLNEFGYVSKPLILSIPLRVLEFLRLLGRRELKSLVAASVFETHESANKSPSLTAI